MTEEYRSVRPSDFMHESHTSANGQPDGSGSMFSGVDSVYTFLTKVSSIITSTFAGCMGKEDDSNAEGGGGERRERGDRGRYENLPKLYESDWDPERYDADAAMRSSFELSTGGVQEPHAAAEGEKPLAASTSSSPKNPA